MSLILHASTTRHDEWGGSKRYIRIIVHDTTAEFQKASMRYRPWVDWSKAAGSFSPAPDREKCNDQGEWILMKPLPWTGVLRLSREVLNFEVITHECVHAAAAIYRMDVKTTINLGYGCGPREETLAYIIGDLTASVAEALHRGRAW